MARLTAVAPGRPSCSGARRGHRGRRRTHRLRPRGSRRGHPVASHLLGAGPRRPLLTRCSPAWSAAPSWRAHPRHRREPAGARPGLRERLQVLLDSTSFDRPTLVPAHRPRRLRGACRIADARGTEEFFVMDENFLKDRDRALTSWQRWSATAGTSSQHLLSAEAITAFGLDNLVRLGVASCGSAWSVGQRATTPRTGH